MTGLVVLLFLPFGFLVAHLPQSVLAATVLVAVVPLIRFRPFVEVFRASRIQFSITITTFVLTLALSPHVERAVIVGAVLSIVIHLWRELRLDVDSSREGDVLHLRPRACSGTGPPRSSTTASSRCSPRTRTPAGSRSTCSRSAASTSRGRSR